jgi:hypothetical protein
MLIDLFSTDLVAGYKEILAARQALVDKWRFDLLRAYTRKRERYARQLAESEARKERYLGFLPFIGIVLAIVCSTGAWLTFRNMELACVGMFLMLGSGFGAIIALAPTMGLSRTPPPPENPVSRTSGEEDESPLRQKLFPRLLPLWRQEMALRIPTEREAGQMAAATERWALTGELDLIRALERVASPETYILHNVRLNPGNDLDVAVIGPRGFWLFEVQTPQLIPMREYPDAQWARLRGEALSYLNQHASNLLKKTPAMTNIQGGLVFSNLQSRIEIDRSAPFRYGTVEQWVAAFQSAPRLKDMTSGRTLQLLETLLKRHQSFYPDAPLRSMKKDAIPRVLAEVEKGIQAWIDT